MGCKMIKIEAKDLAYGGKYYNVLLNVMDLFKATSTLTKVERQIEYIIPNCTVGVYVTALIQGLPKPVKTIVSAKNYHKEVNTEDGWVAIPYTKGMQLQPHDIVEWDCNHVAYVVGNGTNPNIYASWWTNYNGTSKGNRYDTKQTKSLKETSEYFYAKYKNRYFHEKTFENEKINAGDGKNPTYVLRYTKPTVPTIKTVEKDSTKDQIYVSHAEQNIRDEADKKSALTGLSEIGYYNVLSKSVKTDYTWYNIGQDLWIAGVSGRVEFIPKDKTDYKKLYEEAKNKLSEINELAKQIQNISK